MLRRCGDYNHSREFVSPTAVHAQGIEELWGLIKRTCRKKDARSRTTLEEHVHEWTFRKIKKNKIEVIQIVYKAAMESMIRYQNKI